MTDHDDRSASRPLLPLPGWSEARSGRILSALLVLAVLASRALLLPDGPWEQDEALFAAGVHDFDIPHHRPHPPGFIGWIGIGKLIHLAVPDPVVALQWASALASVGLFVVLAHLLTRFTPGRSATLAALAFTWSPLGWVHAARAFSTTPALACSALAVWCWGRATPRVRTFGWVAWALAGTIRPQLAPELVVVAGLGLRLGPDPSRRRWLGFGLATAVGVGALLATLTLGGGTLGDGPAAVWEATVEHLGRHRGGLGREYDWATLGFVRGLGHPVAAALFTLATGLGLLELARQHRARAGWLAGLIAATAVMILGQHHPGFPRYAVALVLVSLPAAAVAVARLPGHAPAVVWASLAVLGGLQTLPTAFAMHDRALPPVAAVRDVATAPDATSFSYSHGSFSFARNALLDGSIDAPGFDVRSFDDTASRAPGAYALEGTTLRLASGVTACTQDYPPVSAAAAQLSQHRFEQARLVRDGVILGPGVHAPENDTFGDRYAWLSGRARLRAPATAQTLVLQLHVPSRHAPQRLTAVQDSVRRHEVTLERGHHRIELPLAPCSAQCDVELVLPDADLEPGDTRELSVQLVAAWARGDGLRPGHQRWSPGRPFSLRTADVQLSGFYPPEGFAHQRRGAWTRARASARFPARPGWLRLRIARPPHTPGSVELRTEAESVTLDVGRAISTVELRTEAPGGHTTLHIETPVFVPRAVADDESDDRELGLIVFDVEFQPDGDGCGTW